MCGRFHNHLKAMERWVDVLKDWPQDIPTSYNVAPTTTVPIVTSQGVVPARWGLIPAWAKEFQSSYATFNARVESASSKPVFRSAWKNSRTCLVPAGGYYEWREENGIKQPYYIHDKKEPVIVFAGLWEQWEDKISCTILTEDSREQLATLHNRMPVMLTRTECENWLENGINATPSTGEALENMAYFAVSTAVNNSRAKGADLIKPLE